MPNWVFNSLNIEGNAEDIVKVKAQLNSPYTREFVDVDWQTKERKITTSTYSNPVFAFWNIIKPTDLEAYHKQPDYSLPIGQALKFESDDWYAWNVRNWGTKWDVAVMDGEKYPETELYDEGETSLSYRFNTAWGVADHALIKLTEQYPNLKFQLNFQEETGWGGEWTFENGEYLTTEEYNWQCSECDYMEMNDPDVNFCEDCDTLVCPSCKYNDSNEVCDKHKEEVNA